jgi:tRNA(fMet)-specific endonuclease VapC
MRYLLDTDIVSLYAREHDAVSERLTQQTLDSLAVSSLTLMEIEFGFAKNPASRRKFGTRIFDLIAEITVVPFANTEAQVTATIRAELERKGQPIGKYDVLIAGTALAQGFVMVTANTREFSKVTGLRFEDWSISE